MHTKQTRSFPVVKFIRKQHSIQQSAKEIKSRYIWHYNSLKNTSTALPNAPKLNENFIRRALINQIVQVISASKQLDTRETIFHSLNIGVKISTLSRLTYVLFMKKLKIEA